MLRVTENNIPLSLILGLKFSRAKVFEFQWRDL